MIGNINSLFRQQALVNTLLNKPSVYAGKSETKPLAARPDSLSVSQAAQEISLLSSITSVKGQPVVDLNAVNNVLNVNKDTYYRMKLPSGLNMVWRADVMLWEDLKAEVGLKTLEPETIGAYNDMSRFIAALSKGHGQTIREFVAAGKAAGFYESLGIKTGAWAEVNSPWRSGPFYITEDGIPYSEEQIENARRGWSAFDYRLQGCTEDSVLVVNGKEYKMDENGHFNIPKGEPVIWRQDMITPPKEMGEYARAKTAQLRAEKAAAAESGGSE